jgi:hypothetical protein
MKRYGIVTILLASLAATSLNAATLTPYTCDPNGDAIGSKTVEYFRGVFEKMGKVAAKDPNTGSFREAMKPVADGVEGFYGGTLVDSNWKIVQVYYKSHFLADGFDLKTVKELKAFVTKMKDAPGPQLSEPAHGSIVQPRLIAMRYPVVKDGSMTKIVSMMVKTESFTKAVGLDECKAYRITCQGKTAEEKGKLSKSPTRVNLTLPATEWVIEYDKRVQK